MQFRPNPLPVFPDGRTAVLGTRYVDAFMEQLRLLAIPVKLVGETRYSLCDTEIP